MPFECSFVRGCVTGGNTSHHMIHECIGPCELLLVALLAMHVAPSSKPPGFSASSSQVLQPTFQEPLTTGTRRVEHEAHCVMTSDPAIFEFVPFFESIVIRGLPQHRPPQQCSSSLLSQQKGPEILCPKWPKSRTCSRLAACTPSGYC